MQLSVREVSKLLNVSEKTIYRSSRMSTSRSTNVHSSVERNIREPGEKVEGLAEVASVVQAPGDRRHVLHRIGDVARASLENRAPFVLREIPPGRGLADRDERRARRLRSPERWRRLVEASLLSPPRSAGSCGRRVEASERRLRQ